MVFVLDVILVEAGTVAGCFLAASLFLIVETAFCAIVCLDGEYDGAAAVMISADTLRGDLMGETGFLAAECAYVSRFRTSTP